MRFQLNAARSRSPRFRSAPFVFLLAASLGAGAACGSDSKPGSHVVQGTSDHTDNGVVSVDEAKIRGSIEDGTLAVDVPVTSLVDHDATGTLILHLVSVDGEDELGTAELPYSLAAGEAATLSASLAAPDGIAEQADLVRFSVRVDDGTAKSHLRVTRSLMYVVPLLDLRVEGPATLHPGRDGYYRGRVTTKCART